MVSLFSFSNTDKNFEMPTLRKECQLENYFSVTPNLSEGAQVDYVEV